MTDPLKPSWLDPLPNPFTLFGGAAPPAAPASPQSSSAQPLAGGMDLFRKFWGNLPGGTALPGFLVPTVDVAELDKRIADLRAAETWLDVNVNLLRATIQGLEVQRHTIAALQSLSTMGEGVPGHAAGPAKSARPAPWPTTSSAIPASPPRAPAAVESPTPAATPDGTPAAAPAGTGDPEPVSGTAGVGPAAGNWLGFLQEQFSKVAQAALATTAPSGPTPESTPDSTPSRVAAKRATRPVARKRKAPARKRATP